MIHIAKILESLSPQVEGRRAHGCGRERGKAELEPLIVSVITIIAHWLPCERAFCTFLPRPEAIQSIPSYCATSAVLTHWPRCRKLGIWNIVIHIIMIVCSPCQELKYCNSDLKSIIMQQVARRFIALATPYSNHFLMIGINSKTFTLPASNLCNS